MHSASFKTEPPGQKFELTNISGFRISVCLTPSQGFQGQFYVYVWQRIAAKARLDPVSPGGAGQTLRGTLVLAGDTGAHEFHNIDLVGVETGVTRHERLRLLEFQYDRAFTDTKKLPATLRSLNTSSLPDGRLGNDYKFGLEKNRDEHLLGFRSRQSASGAAVLRFSSLLTDKQSWLQEIVKANDQRTQPGKGFPEFEINFSPGRIKVNQENLNLVFVDESYGEMLRFPPPSLRDLTPHGHADQQAELIRLAGFARLNMASHSPETLLVHDSLEDFHAAVGPETVETATFLFKAGYYRELLFS
jgi:hypothetical protein